MELRLASMAMRMPSDLRSSGLGSVQRRETKFGNDFYVLSRTGKMRKEAVLNSVLLIRKIQISYKMTIIINSFFNSLGNSYIKASYIMVIIHIK